MLCDLSALSVFNLSLALIISDVGFLKPNISTIVGKFYSEDDPRPDAGFTLFYAGINVGACSRRLFAAIQVTPTAGPSLRRGYPVAGTGN